MKKITSFLMMLLLCCTSVFAQGATEYVDKLIRIGTVQTEMVPGKWYFLHTPRNINQTATAEDYALDGVIQSKGGLVYDNTSNVSVSRTTVIDELTAEEGVSSNDYLKMMVRFVAVEWEEGAYNIQFGNGKWMAENPMNATCSNYQYLAGEVGKFNFYHPTIGGVPSTLGRFAWNAYNMAQRVDNNGAGSTVVFWAEGEVTGETEGWTTEEEIGGNKIWEIFDVEVIGDVDKWQEMFENLLDDYTTITSQGDGTIIDQLIAGENVGNAFGNYRPEDVQAFLALHAQVEELLMLAETEGMEAIQKEYSTASDLKAFYDRYVDAWNHMIENKVPLAMTGIQPGYYTFNSCLFWYTTKNDTVFYTQEEADEANAESGCVEGDDGYVAAGDVKDVTSSQVAAPKKALYSAQAMGGDGVMGDWLAWGTQEPNAAFLWKVEAVEGKPTEYRMINMWNSKTHISIGQVSNSRLELNDTATVCFDFRNDKEEVKYMDGEEEKTEIVTSFNIRSSKQAADNYYYLHCGGHLGGAGTNGWIVGWSDGGPTRWYMTPVDEATVNQWLGESEGPRTLLAMITKGDSIAAAFPAQLDVAKDIEITIYENDSVVVTADQFYSQYTTEDAQAIPEGQTVYDFLLDGKQSTYWHSRWENGFVGQKVHYLQINAAETLEGMYAVKLQRRPVSGDHITKLSVVGYANEPTDETTFEEGVYLGDLNLPLGSNNETVVSKAFDASGMKYLRFYSVETKAVVGYGGGANRGYWHAAGFNVFKASAVPRYATTQYDVRKAEAEALAEAVAVWNERGYTNEDVALLEDEGFQQAYANLVAAAEAWGAVYVDPTALRELIAATPSSELFVTGNNPGQWKEGTVAPAEAVTAAIAYNASGAYTPAQSEAHIAAIQNMETATFESANKVETGKWYRFSFATEETYEKFGWDKTSAKAVEHEAAGVETQPALFGKTLAIGKKFIDYVGFVNEYGENDTIAVNLVEEKEEWFEGDNLCFFEDADFSNGEDLFRFIQATDSSFMIQNKATGLFLRAGYPVQLSAVPSYFSVQAIGAGANLIASTNVLGGNEQGYNYLHAERPTNTLTTWDADNLGSNSMIFIEEVEPVTEEPSTEYRAKLWPGQVYAYTYPVDVTISEGATAYAAELTVTGNRSTVALQPMENATIKAGTPFVMIANPALVKDQERAGEYISSADRLKQIAAEILAENGQYGRNEQVLANVRLNDEYAIVTMNHGMTVSTNVDANYSLRGTMKQTMVEAGQAILPKENGFGPALVNKSIAAYGAWIASDFDANAPLPNLNVVFGEIGDSIVVPDDTTSVVDPVRTPLITDANQLSSPFTDPNEGALEFLIDGDHASFWHSDWSGGFVEGGHYLQIELHEYITGSFYLYMKRRVTHSDHPSLVRITGSETADFSSETLNILVNMPNAESGAESSSEEWMIDTPTKYLRIEAVDCKGEDFEFRGYWHAAELQVYQTGEGKDWSEIMAGRIAGLADYPAMQAELQSAYEETLTLPEDGLISAKKKVNQLYIRIMNAVTCYGKLATLIAQADSVLETTTDAELHDACQNAKKIDAQTSVSEQIISAYNVLSQALWPYIKHSIPMDQWNFTTWYEDGNGLAYELDTKYGLARAHLYLFEDNRLSTRIEIPEFITYNDEQYLVVAMGHSQGNYPEKLNTLVLPNSIRYIGEAAFTNNLQDVIIAATEAPQVYEWQDVDFSHLKVTIPNGSMNSYRFTAKWSDALLVQQTPVEITIALSTPGELGYKVMEHVDYIQEVNKLTITSGTLNSTDWNTLKSMKNLMELDIESCENTAILYNQFNGSHLEVIKLPRKVKEIHEHAFAYSRRLTSVIIPDSTLYINYAAFEDCQNLRNVVLNEGLEEIRGCAFFACDIRSISFPSSLRRIANDAFAYNRKLGEVNFNEGLEEISHAAFNDCDSLREVVLPSTLVRCYRPFESCDNLTTIISNSLLPANTEGDCPVNGVNLANVVLKVPVFSVDEYKFASGWSQIPIIEVSDIQPENIVISRDFTLRTPESEMDDTYRPNVSLKWSNISFYDEFGHWRYETGNLTTNPGTRLNAKSFSMFYSHYGKYHDEENWTTERNATSLLVNGSMSAENVTITLMNRNFTWQFVSFPFDVCMSDIVPVDPNTVWVVREYSGAERANGNMHATWVDLTNDDVLEAGKGYIMHCYNANNDCVMFQVKVNSTSQTSQNIFIASDAEINLEEHIAEYEYNSSWNLVGNPYPCYYDTRFMDFNAPITVWNSNRRNYEAYSPLDDDYILYPGEAFFVQRPKEQESVVFIADGRQTDSYAREMANARKSEVGDRMVYNIILKGENTSDRTRVVLNETASMGYEMTRDASKFDALSNDASQIYTMIGNTRMAINERPVGSGVVELGMSVPADGVYTISLKQANDRAVVLEDRTLGIRTVLSADSEYTFNAKAGKANGRFFLHFDGTETGVQGVGMDNANGEPVFNTAGQRVEETQKGIVIKEGKKLMNK